jgi:trans-aconitate 2-methyltransferase
MRLLSPFLLLLAALASHAHVWDAKDYNTNSASQKTAAERLLANHDLNVDGSLLDVGCGDGKITHSLAQKLNGKVVGLDKSQAMIEYGQKTFTPNDPNLEFIVGDAAQLDFHNQFDYVTSFSALQWVPNQKAAMAGMFEALKPGGQLFITMPRHYPECLSNAILDVSTRAPYNQNFVGFQAGQVFFGVDEYQHMLREAGFTNVAVSYVDGHDRFPSVQAFSNFVKQWLPWAQVFTDPSEKEEFMKKLMVRYTAYCPAQADGSVMFLKQQLEAVATKPSAAQP